MAAAAKAGKVPAVVLNLPSAPDTWHFVEGVAGLFHPSVPVPSGPGEAFVAAHKRRVADAKAAWDRFEAEQVGAGNRVHGPIPFTGAPCGLRVVQVSEREAAEGAAVQAGARKRAAKALGEARRGGSGDVVLAHVENAAVAGGKE